MDVKTVALCHMGWSVAHKTVADGQTSSSGSAGAELALLAVLRGRRRKLCDMTLPDEELEYRLKGFRFCHWIERWRLACNVLTISLGRCASWAHAL